jgi:hypothetical protein
MGRDGTGEIGTGGTWGVETSSGAWKNQRSYAFQSAIARIDCDWGCVCFEAQLRQGRDVNSVRDILEAIRALPRPDRLRLAEQLSEELGSEPLQGSALEPPTGSRLVLVNGFHVFTGPVTPAELDHRIDREEHLAHLVRSAGAGRD